jgi:hypothetical protein
MVDKTLNSSSQKKIVFSEQVLLEDSLKLFKKMKSISNIILEQFERKKNFLKKNEICINIHQSDIKNALSLKKVIKELYEFIYEQKKEIDQLLQFEKSEVYVYNYLASSIRRIDYQDELSKNFHSTVSNFELPTEKLKYELHFLEQKTKIMLTSNSYLMRDLLVVRLGPTINRSVKLVETLIESLNLQFNLIGSWHNEIEKLIKEKQKESDIKLGIKQIFEKYQQKFSEELNKEHNIEYDLYHLFSILVEIEKGFLNLKKLKIEVIDLKNADNDKNHPKLLIIKALKNAGKYRKGLYYRGFDGNYINIVQKYGTDMPESKSTYVAPESVMEGKTVAIGGDPIVFALNKKIPAMVVYDGQLLTRFRSPSTADFKWSAIDAVVALFKFKNHEHLLNKLTEFKDDFSK